MVPIGMERNRYTAKKSAMAAVAVFVALAAVPVLADTAQEKVISRLSSETSTGVGGQNTRRNKAMQSVTTASLQMSQEQEQGTYQEQVISRLSSEASLRAGSKSEVDNGLQPGAASLVSQDLERYRQMISTRLHGE